MINKHHRWRAQKVPAGSLQVDTQAELLNSQASACFLLKVSFPWSMPAPKRAAVQLPAQCVLFLPTPVLQPPWMSNNISDTIHAETASAPKGEGSVPQDWAPFSCKGQQQAPVLPRGCLHTGCDNDLPPQVRFTYYIVRKETQISRVEEKTRERKV